ncbi:hypothetical protein [Glycomyces harbinensis]|uniref:hypothetical protein n=1 Tax=Glycomyces harbinensis TaxID=58114 RepID=UPI00115FA065|nr:hypothetical protein [Glycomyces harbinensis]
MKYSLTRLADVSAGSMPQAKVAGGIEYTVICRRCNGSFKVMNYEGQYLSGFGARKKATAPQPIGVVCDCGLDHKNRPAGSAGCGAVWDIVH